MKGYGNVQVKPSTSVRDTAWTSWTQDGMVEQPFADQINRPRTYSNFSLSSKVRPALNLFMPEFEFFDKTPKRNQVAPPVPRVEPPTQSENKKTVKNVAPQAPRELLNTPNLKPETFPFTPPLGWRELQGKNYQQWSASRNKPSVNTSDAITTPSIEGNPEQPFGFNTRLNWMDKANIANAGYNALNINRYMPMRSQIRTSPVRLNRVDPQAAINQVNESIYNATNANRVMNPYLAQAQNASMYGRHLGALNQVRSQYDQQNAQIGNQEITMNAQMAQQDAIRNAGFDQQYYQQTIEGAKNFDNARAFGRNRLFDVTGNAYEKAIQAQAMNMQLGPESPYYYDYENMRVTPNPNRNIMNSLSGKSGQLEELLQKLSSKTSLTKEESNLYNTLIRLYTAKDYKPTGKKGGKINPYR